MFAYVANNTIEMVGGLPASARRLDNQKWVLGLPNADVADQEACGWFRVVETAAPSVSDTQRAEVTVELVNGVPTQVWTVRNETEDERKRRVRHANTLSMSDVQAGIAAIQANEAYLAWYTSSSVQTVVNGSGNMSSAQLSDGIRRLAPQVDRLTRIVNRLVRLQLGEALLDSTQSS